MNHELPIDAWRRTALEFHAIREAATWQLSDDFGPDELAHASRCWTGAIQGIVRFLLHAWNNENPFDLSDVRRWDRQHRATFTAWVTGQLTGEPCHYF